MRILEDWILLAIHHPVAEALQADGRIRRWVYIPEEARYLRVILLADGETVHKCVFRPKVQGMNVKYFRDTDAALLEFSDAILEETREISENVYIDLDKSGNLVSMTIEHAAMVANLPQVNLEEIDASAA